MRGQRKGPLAVFDGDISIFVAHHNRIRYWTQKRLQKKEGQSSNGKNNHFKVFTDLQTA